MFGLGMGELVLIFIIALIFIGPKKLPELAKGLGQGIRDFQKAAKGLTDEFQNSVDTPSKPADPVIPSVPEHHVADTSHHHEHHSHGDETFTEPEHMDPPPTDKDKPQV